jgi:L-alanine-DL-glutamate epimerase and related enzymes of enolase superfamily
METIKDLRCYSVPAPGKRWVILVIETNSGLTGLGEGTLSFPACQADAVVASIHQARGFLLGKDASRISRLWSDLYEIFYWRGGPAAMTALGTIDQALWDIAGKMAGQPLFQLLGGAFNDTVRTYTNGWWGTNPTSEQLVERAQIAVSEGANALKWYPFRHVPGSDRRYHVAPAEMKAAIAEVEAMRSALGPSIDLMVDVWRRLDTGSAIEFCRAVESLGLLFVEEPVVAENADILAKVARSTTARLAAGERLLTKWEFRPLIERQLVSFVQPDVPRVGGITEARKIAALAETYGIGVAPHNPVGAVGTAAAAQLAFSLSNFVILECFSTKEQAYRQDFVSQDLPRCREGFSLPTAPGLGLLVDEAYLARYRCTF